MLAFNHKKTPLNKYLKIYCHYVVCTFEDWMWNYCNIKVYVNSTIFFHTMEVNGYRQPRTWFTFWSIWIVLVLLKKIVWKHPYRVSVQLPQSVRLQSVYLLYWFPSRWRVLWVPVDGQSSADLVSALGWNKRHRCCTTLLHIGFFTSHE